MQAQPRKYRSDIQALRGVAVLLVVLYHAFDLPGGYLGVDIFFAISGFVICQSVVRTIEDSGSFSIVNFIGRRVRRLLPALFVTIVVTTGLSLLFLSPIGAGQLVGPTARAAALNIANFELYSQADYFSPAAELNPLLHTWSLSVEEQFYLGFALLVGALSSWSGARFRRRFVIALLVIGLGSLISSIAASYALIDWPSDPLSFAFYSSTARAFEFILGALYALALPRLANRQPRAWSIAGPVAGIALLIVSAVTIGDTTTPAAAALFPMIAFLLLVTPQGSPAWIDDQAWSRPWQRLGDISYSVYLVHWPLLVLLRAVSDVGTVVALVLVLPVAILLHVTVERRFRNAGSTRSTLAILVIAIVVPVVAAAGAQTAMDTGLGLAAVPEFDGRTQARELLCHGDLDDPILEVDDCYWPSEQSRGLVMLVGDSHAVSLADALIASANAEQLDVHIQTRSLCPFGTRRIKRRGCANYQRETIARIQELQPDVLIIANRAPSYVLSPGDDVAIYSVVDADDNETQAHTDALDAWSDGLAEAITQVRESVGRTVIFDTVAEFEDASARESISVLRPDGESESITIAQLNARREPTSEIHEMLADAFPTVDVVDPAQVLCTTVCSQRVDGRWYYYDDDHLSLYGAEVAATLFEPFWQLGEVEDP